MNLVFSLFAPSTTSRFIIERYFLSRSSSNLVACVCVKERVRGRRCFIQSEFVCVWLRENVWDTVRVRFIQSERDCVCERERETVSCSVWERLYRGVCVRERKNVLLGGEIVGMTDWHPEWSRILNPQKWDGSRSPLLVMSQSWFTEKNVLLT